MAPIKRKQGKPHDSPAETPYENRPIAKKPKRAEGAQSEKPKEDAAKFAQKKMWKDKPRSEGVGTGEFRAPEASEVLEISRTRSLYKSNLFRLQLEELLKELAPRKSGAAYVRLEGVLRSLRPLLMEQLASRQLPCDLAAEFPELSFHQQGGPQPSPLGFAPPTRVDVVGSFLLGSYLRGTLDVDLALEMPSDMFRSKDYLNFRYHDKRAAYAGEVHKQLSALLKDSSAELLSGLEVELEALQGDQLRPCVLLRPKAEGNSEGKAGQDGAWSVRLLPTYPPELFQLRMLGPDRNAVRPEGAGDADSLPPTAYYNSCVLEDSKMRSHLEALHKALQRFPALRDSILLLKRWAVACGFLSPATTGVTVFTPLNGFVLSMLAAHAGLTASVAAAQTSAFELFKLTLSVLSATDWSAQKLVFGKAEAAALSAEERKASAAHFYDAEGYLNVLWRVGPFMEEIQWEAKRALRILDSKPDPFDSVFGRRVAPELAYDLILRTPPLGPGALCPDLRTDSASGSTAPTGHREHLHGADAPQAIATCSQLVKLMSAGLGDRCSRAAVRLVGESRVVLSSRKKDKNPVGSVAVMIGLQLDPLNVDRALDRGPSAQEEGASTLFRELWGPQKAELRRFKDGSIQECAVWVKPPPARSSETRKQPAVITQVVRHLLNRHMPKMAKEVDILAGPVGIVQNLNDRERKLWAAFEIFRQHLCQLSSLPLTIKDIHPKDASFSYTEVSPEVAPPSASGSDGGLRRNLHGVVLEFESSGRWPEDPDAARKVAGALLLQIREELANDLGIESDVTEAFLDVRYPEAVFRLQVFHPHELTEAASKITNIQAHASGSAPPSPESVERIRRLWWQPRCRASMHAHTLQQPAFAGAVRLCKRWMASQMLSGYDEFVEHLVASVFLHPAPFEVPTSPQVGFSRFCWLLDNFDWQREPLIVDLDGKLTDEERLGLRQCFEKNRDDTAKATSSTNGLWICSRFDPHTLLLPGPPATIATWLRRRARQCLAACGRRVLGLPSRQGGSVDWKAVFELDTSSFDLLLRLLPPPDDDEGNQSQPQREDEDDEEQPKGKRGKAEAAAKRRLSAQLVSRQAAETLVGSLREQLSPVCLVLHDAQNQLLALKWRPGAFLPQHTNILMGSIPHTMIPQEGGQPLCVPNILCLTSAIASLVHGMALEVNLVVSRG